MPPPTAKRFSPIRPIVSFHAAVGNKQQSMPSIESAEHFPDGGATVGTLLRQPDTGPTPGELKVIISQPAQTAGSTSAPLFFRANL